MHASPDFRKLRRASGETDPPRPAPVRKERGPSNRTIATALAVILTAGIVGAGSARLVMPSDATSSQDPNTPISSQTPTDPEEALQSAISRVQGSVVEVRVPSRGFLQSGSQGSGVVVRPTGLIVTNHHVVGNAERVEVITASGQSITAHVIERNEGEDLAILRPVSTAGPGVDLVDDSSGPPRNGKTVFAIGSPFGLQNTVTAGVVSAFRTDNGRPVIQFDAPVNPGNSGGGLFDLDGRLVGIPTAIRTPDSGNVGIAFAVPSSRVRALLARIS